MSVRRIEALADALAKMYGSSDPQSDSYQLRNPGMLLAFNPKHDRDVKGRRRFKTFIAGYENLLLDLKIKCSGNSRARLTPESQLVDLLHVYGNPTSSLKYVINFIRHALGDDSVPNEVALGWFLIEPEVKTDA